MSAQPIPFASVPKPVPDLEEIMRASLVIIGRGKGRVIEIRALNTRKGTVSGYYDTSAFVQHVYEISKQEGVPAVYWTIQNIRRDGLKVTNIWETNVSRTTSDNQIDRYVWLPIDCDPVRPAGTSSTDAEKAAALNVAHEIRDILLIRGIESILADSGNGHHVLVPIDLEATDESKQLVKSLLRVLDSKFGTEQTYVDQRVFNPSRILKIYGTVARKGEHTDERPWRTARLVEVPDSLPVISEAQLRSVLEDFTKELPPAEVTKITEKKKYEPPQPGAKITENRNNACHDYCFDVWVNSPADFDVEDLREKVYAFNEEFCSPQLDEEELDRTTIASVQKHRKRFEETITFNGKPGGQPAKPKAELIGPEIPAPAEWREPEEIQDALLPVLPFKLEYLPFSLRGWALDVSERMSIPLDFTGVSTVVALAGAIGRRAFIYPKAEDKDWKEAIAVSGAIIASSGKLKTPCFNVYMAPFRELEADWREEKKEDWAKYHKALKAWKQAQKNAEKAKEEFIEEEPEEPTPARRVMLNDSTPEAAHDIMTYTPEGILLYRDEFASWTAELEKEGRELERGLYLAAMNGDDPHNVDRTGRGSSNAIMCASLYGGFQPALLKEFLGNMRNQADGLLARFGALCWPDEVKLPPMDRKVNDSAKQAYRSIIVRLAKLTAKTVQLHFAPDAQVRFKDWLNIHTDKIDAESNVAIQSHLSKYRGMLPKLAGLLMLADLAASAPEHTYETHGKVETRRGGLEGYHQVDLAHLEQAIGLIEYFESHMARVYACLKDANQLAEEALARHIRQGELKDSRQGRDGLQLGFTSYDIQRHHWTHLSKEAHIDFAIDSLEDKGWIRVLPVERPKGGRPAYRWEINPVFKKRGEWRSRRPAELDNR